MSVVKEITDKAAVSLDIKETEMQGEAHFEKLLLYEGSYGHHSRRCSRANEPHHFATLEILLPTQEGYVDGALVSEHGNTCKTFDFSEESNTGFFYTVTHVNCEREIKLCRMESGYLCFIIW